MYNKCVQTKTIHFKIITYLVFAVCIIAVMPSIYSKELALTAVRLQELERYTSYSAMVLFFLSVIAIALYALSYLAVHFGENSSEISILKLFKRDKYPRGKAVVIGKITIGLKNIPLAKIVIFDETEHEIGCAHSDLNGNFKISLPSGAYIFQTESFGIEGKASKPIFIRENETIQTELKCFYREDMLFNPRIYYRLIMEKYLLFLIAVLSPAVCYLNWIYNFKATGFLVAIIGLLLFGIFAQQKSDRLIIRDRKSKKLKNTLLQISDSTGKKTQSIRTNYFGNVFILLSPGIYKIQKKGTLGRSIRISSRTIASADIKLG